MRPTRLLELAGTATVGLMLLSAILANGRTGDSAQLAQAEALYAQGMELSAADGADAAAQATAKFRESAATIEAELSRADSAGMHFNRANALLQAGDLGEAIASYRAAELRAPADARVAANLAEARSKVARSMGAPAATTLEDACGLWAAASEQARLFIAVALGFAAIVALRMRARASGVACGVIAALVAATVAADIARRGSADLAVVIEPSMLRKGNGEGFEQVVAEALPEGTECRVREARPGWIEVEIAGGTRGWVKDAGVVRVE